VARLERSAALIGYGHADAKAVRGTREILQPSAERIVERVRERLAAHPETAPYADDPAACFGGADAGMGRWFELALSGTADEWTATFLAEAGRAHTRRRRESRINARYLVFAMEMLRQAVIDELRDGMGDDAARRSAEVAWAKLMTLHLDLMLSVYSGSEANTHWY
jgi:hypothetical protein